MLPMRCVLITSVLSTLIACGPAQQESAPEDENPGPFDAMTRQIQEAEQVEELNRQQKVRMDAAIEGTQNDASRQPPN